MRKHVEESVATGVAAGRGGVEANTVKPLSKNPGAVHPQAKPDVPATDRQRAYLASLAVKREDGEAVMERLGITDPWAPSLSRGRVSAGIDILVKRPDRKLTKEDRAKLREVEAEGERRNPPPKLSNDEKTELLEAWDNFDENDPEYQKLIQGWEKKAPVKSKRLRPKQGS